MAKPYIIGIAGESGVGKSSIALIVSLFYGKENVLILSTDDLHKWDRLNSNWQNITHLNPEANNLDLGDFHLRQLISGQNIYRSIYNHKTGYFDPPSKIEPRPIIIIEGLHAFFTEFSLNSMDLKIFVDTDEDLRIHWKIVRDTEERGYTYNKVLESINKRRIDAEKIKKIQLPVADAIIKLVPEEKIIHVGDKHEKTKIRTEIIYNDCNKELFTFIESYIQELDNFVFLCELYGNNIEHCQDGGGNISVKIGLYSIIKSSGTNLKDITVSNGFSIIEHNQFDSINHSLEYDLLLKSYKNRPSMESGFHALLQKYTIHLHPAYLLLILCLKNSKEIIDDLFKNFSYNYLEYINPGFDLFQKMKSEDKSNNIFFLENHGVIVSSDNLDEAILLYKKIFAVSKEYVESHFGIFHCEVQELENFTFPDAVIFNKDILKKEILEVASYINNVGQDKLRFLTQEQIMELNNIESEKWRKNK